MVVAAAERPDLGSLNAFLHEPAANLGDDLGLPNMLKRSEVAAAAKLAAPPGAPMLPPRPGGNSTKRVLNQKTAFKMLKQLGCVCKFNESDGQPYIEVAHSAQPVLFKMLLDFGYQPLKDEDGVPVIHVNQPRMRTQEEIIASLTAPRQPKPPPPTEMEKASSATSRPRLLPEEEAELVQRLAARRKPKLPPEEETTKEQQQEAHKFRSATEQRAHLDRLLRPRASSSVDLDVSTAAPEHATLPPSQFTFGHSSASNAPGKPLLRNSPSAPPATWPPPVPARGNVHVTRAARAGRMPPTSKAGMPSEVGISTGPLRPSPRLAHAGLVALTPSPGSSHTESPVPDGPLESSTSAISTDQPGITLASGEPSETMMSGISDQLPLAATDTKLEEPSAENATASSSLSSEPNKEDTGDWLDRILGPMSMPGRSAAPRSRAEHHERLKKLSKPRPRPDLPVEQPAPVAQAPRSPRAQREACSRLAEPRKPKVAADEEHTIEPSHVDDIIDVGSTDTAFGSDEAVLVIPSLLTQLPQRLERIDEDPPPEPAKCKKGTSKVRPKARSSSLPAPAAPYAAPVFPAPKPASCSTSSGSHKRSNSVCGAAPPSTPLVGTAASCLEWLEQRSDNSCDGEEMLSQIDYLYSEFLGGASRMQQDRTPCVPLPNHMQPCVSKAGSSHDVPVHVSCDPGFGGLLGRTQRMADGIRLVDHYSQTAPAPSSAVKYPDIHELPLTPSSGQGEDGEALLATIDHLYTEILNSGGHGAALPAHSLDSALGPCDTKKASSDEYAQLVDDAARQELCKLLEEVLWSALLLGRSAGENVCVQSHLLDLLPAQTLSRCLHACGRCSLPHSLLQRLASEMPHVHGALTCGAPVHGKHKPHVASNDLTEVVRRARDGLLSLASSTGGASGEPFEQSAKISSVPEPLVPEDVSSACTQSDSQEHKARKTKPRRTSLSYWTPESIAAVEVPRGRASDILAGRRNAGRRDC